MEPCSSKLPVDHGNLCHQDRHRQPTTHLAYVPVTHQPVHRHQPQANYQQVTILLHVTRKADQFRQAQAQVVQQLQHQQE
jgi:hypothetical protein